MTRFNRGDVVYPYGSSGMLGDVTDVEEPDDPEDNQNVTVMWRRCESTEYGEDIVLATPEHIASVMRRRQT